MAADASAATSSPEAPVPTEQAPADPDAPRITGLRRSGPTAPAARSAPSMAATPEAMLFTMEYDAGATTTIGRAASPTITPSLLSQLAEASRAQTPVTPTAMPDEISLVIRDAAGDIRLEVGRDQKDVAVKVEVPTGLLAAIQEAEAPIRASLHEEGFELEGYEVQEREDGIDQAPHRDDADHRARHPRDGAGRSDRADAHEEPTERERTTGPRLLNRRA